MSFCAWMLLQLSSELHIEEFLSALHSNPQTSVMLSSSCVSMPACTAPTERCAEAVFGACSRILQMDASDKIASQRAGICVQVLSFPAGIPRRTAACSCGAHPTQVRAIGATGRPLDSHSYMLRHAR